MALRRIAPITEIIADGQPPAKKACSESTSRTASTFFASSGLTMCRRVGRPGAYPQVWRPEVGIRKVGREIELFV